MSASVCVCVRVGASYKSNEQFQSRVSPWYSSFHKFTKDFAESNVYFHVNFPTYILETAKTEKRRRKTRREAAMTATSVRMDSICFSYIFVVSSIIYHIDFFLLICITCSRICSLSLSPTRSLLRILCHFIRIYSFVRVYY